MHHIFLPLALSTLLVPGLAAQAIFDDFTYTDGPVPSVLWTVKTGTWAIRNGKLIESPSTLGHKYITRNFTNATDCVVEVDCKWSTQVIQAGGPTARDYGGTTENCVMGKVQSNSVTPAGFDYMYLYERPGSVVSKPGIVPPLTDVRVRLIVLGAAARLAVDSDRNGTFDMEIGPLALTSHSAPGLVGIVTGNSPTTQPTEIDNFAFYDAVLMLPAATPPKVGTPYPMDLYTPAPQFTPFAALLAQSAGTVPVGAGRAIPLAPDAMFNFSLQVGGALGLFGITDAAGHGVPTLNIPNLPALVGLQLFTAGFTLDPTKSLGVGYISNNQSFVIQA